MMKSEYENFLQQILDSEDLEEVVIGVTKQVIAKGEPSLSKKQEYVFRTQIKEVYIKKICKECSGDIPFCEMYGCGGVCGWCTHRIYKERRKELRSLTHQKS